MSQVEEGRSFKNEQFEQQKRNLGDVHKELQEMGKELRDKNRIYCFTVLMKRKGKIATPRSWVL